MARRRNDEDTELVFGFSGNLGEVHELRDKDEDSESEVSISIDCTEAVAIAAIKLLAKLAS